jgi:hypothetical protein
MGGAVRKVTDGGTEINLGDTFEEKLDIKSIQPFEGDVIHEGRWGQSLRFGSSTPESKIVNPWSYSGTNGDPIIIFKNGQHDDGRDPWIPQIEDINKDISSIYFTSTQTIPIEVASKTYDSYETPPIAPKEYNKGQLIITSDRLLLNAKEDSILFSSKKTINLNSIDSVNIDTKKTIVNSKEVLLGGKEATEPFILGDIFLKDIDSLLKILISLSDAIITNPVGTPVPNVPHPQLPVVAPQLKQIATTMSNKIEKYKSKISKSK